MKIDIERTFTGWPDPSKGDQEGETFKAGAKGVEVPDEFGEMVIGKGLAKAADGEQQPRRVSRTKVTDETE